MSLDLQVVPHKQYLQVVLSGEISLESATDAIATVIDLAWEQRQPRILIDWRAISGLEWLSTLDRYEGTRYLAQLVGDIRAKGMVDIRVVHITSEIRPEAEGFSETVASNRGVETFIATDMQTALAWLGVDESADA